MKDSGFGAGWHAGSALSGVLSGLALGVMFGMWFGPDVIKAPEACEGNAGWCLLYTWQTLIAGIFATVAAGVGAYFLWVQIEQQKEVARQEAERRQIASRLPLPHALSEIHAYLELCYEAWKKKDILLKPVAPKEALELVMKAAVEAEGRAFDVLKLLITHSQVFEARAVDRVKPKFYEQFLLDILKYFRFLDTLYNYGRFRGDVEILGSPDANEYMRIMRSCLGWHMEAQGDLQGRVIDALSIQFSRASAEEYFKENV